MIPGDLCLPVLYDTGQRSSRSWSYPLGLHNTRLMGISGYPLIQCPWHCSGGHLGFVACPGLSEWPHMKAPSFFGSSPPEDVATGGVPLVSNSLPTLAAHQSLQVVVSGQFSVWVPCTGLLLCSGLFSSRTVRLLIMQVSTG